LQYRFVRRTLSGAIDVVPPEPALVRVDVSLYFFDLVEAVDHEVLHVRVQFRPRHVLRPSNRHARPVDVVLEGQHELVAEDDGDAPSEKARVQVVRPRARALRNEAEVRIAHYLEVVLHEAPDGYVGSVLEVPFYIVTDLDARVIRVI